MRKKKDYHLSDSLIGGKKKNSGRNGIGSQQDAALAAPIWEG